MIFSSVTKKTSENGFHEKKEKSIRLTFIQKKLANNKSIRRQLFMNESQPFDNDKKTSIIQINNKSSSITTHNSQLILYALCNCVKSDLEKAVC